MAALFGLVFGACAVLFLMVLSLVLGYAGGSVFDHILGTTITPITTIYGLMRGISVYYASQKRDWRSFSLLGGLFTAFVVAPLVALLGAWLALWLFPGTAQAFLQMVGYGGSLYELAFWGTLTMSLIKTVVDTVALLVAGFFTD
jgi:hypothetical protein